MKLKKAFAMIMTFMLVFVSLSFGNVVFADSADIGEVAMVLTANNERPTGPNDPDILRDKPALNSEFYLWVMTSPINELVGVDTWVTFDSTKLSVADMDSETTGVQPVDTEKVDINQVTADVLNTVAGNVIKYAASNTSASDYSGGAALLMAKFKVNAEITYGTLLSFSRLELRGKLGTDNNPIKLIPENVFDCSFVPGPPAGGTVNDATNTYTFIPNTAYPNAADYEYSLNSGETWQPCTGFVITVGNVNLPAEAVQVRVKADTATGRPAGIAQMSDKAYTVNTSGLTATPALNSTAYGRGNEVTLNLNLSGVATGDKTNSVIFEIVYDTSAFELLTGNINSDVINTYIPFVDKKVMTVDSTHSKLMITYVGLADIPLVNNSSVLTAKFKVKDNASFGTKSFTLLPINMLDSEMKLYTIDNNVANVEISDLAYVEGYFDIYLGNVGTGLFNNNFNNLNQNALNTALESLNFTLSNSADASQTFTGSQVIVLTSNNNLADKNTTTNKVIGKFKIPVSNAALNTLTISGDSYLKKVIGNINVAVGQIYSINNSDTPVTLYPGDIGQILDGKLTSIPDGSFTNIDFSAWLRIYKNLNTATGIELQMADINKDGVITNIDFSTWLSSYKIPAK